MAISLVFTAKNGTLISVVKNGSATAILPNLLINKSAYQVSVDSNGSVVSTCKINKHFVPIGNDVSICLNEGDTVTCVQG